ncbi:MAG TPA: hypothetical protein P5234_10865 [Thermoanaerobaculaceae bacterium]|nr:hypothetical protein [Thermoanaerobaculaceae bacterium]HRS16730.1 hypothetical protein [Thermoanaerobaculaceae bacterium]
MPEETRPDLAAVLAELDAGREPEELRLLAVLRRPECPRDLIERLCTCRWVLRRRRVATLVVRHPACRHPFAWQVLPYLGWHDLHEVCRDPRTAPAIRAQAERKLGERLASMALGERISLARVASRGVVRALLGDPEVACIEALLGNPRFTEDEALRVLVVNPNPDCLAALLRHEVWGRRRAVVRAAVRSPRLPLGLLAGLAATLSDAELADLLRGGEAPDALADALAELLLARRAAPDGVSTSDPS